MTDEALLLDDDHVDDAADNAILEYLDLDNPKSFFLYAGAGSGKTRSLVSVLNDFREVYGERLRLERRRIGVITYTNAACDEITRRLEFDPLVEVSTIHSFVWKLIGTFHSDIRKWLEVKLQDEIAELQKLQAKGKPESKAAMDRKKSIVSKEERLTNLSAIRRFTYNPNGENIGRDSLNHAEVIRIGADSLNQKRMMRSILINKFPVLLIDESQDTNRLLIEALLSVQDQNPGSFLLGLFGDTMQRIYGDGKIDLGENLPESWGKPSKIMNHRSGRRIVDLANKIREPVDHQPQRARKDSPEGIVRLFVLPSETINKFESEEQIAAQMAEICEDRDWTGEGAIVKTLTLEHHMAAARMGFLDMFEPLYQVDRFRTGLLDGSLPGLRLFTGLVLPLVRAKQKGNEFAAATVVKEYSPLIRRSALRTAGSAQLERVHVARNAVEELLALWRNGGEPSFMDVLRCVNRTGLFEIPDSLKPISDRSEEEQEFLDSISDFIDQLGEADDDELVAWETFLQTSFSQLWAYDDYVNDRAAFGTHQGVKGLEFPRVMVVIDDAEARGFMFSYEKLFGVKEKTRTDLENEKQGRETGIDRTRRLFYVTCTRAELSLAIVAYSSDPEALKGQVLENGWFSGDEIVVPL